MITLNDARRILAAAQAEAERLGQPVNIAVVDAGAHLVAQIRMDGARIGAIQIAIDKAFTARAFDMSTAALAEHSQPGGAFFGIHSSNGGRVMIFAGGLPLHRDAIVVGAIGVSGGSGEQDEAIARAGVEAFC